MSFHSFCCPNSSASRALRVALEDGAREGGVGVGVLPVAVEVEGADGVGDQVEDAEDLQRGILVQVCSVQRERETDTYSDREKICVLPALAYT